MGFMVKDPKKFKACVKRKSKTAKKFADSIGISDRYLSSITNQKRSISAPLAILVSHELNINKKDLFFDVNVELSKTEKEW